MMYPLEQETKWKTPMPVHLDEDMDLKTRTVKKTKKPQQYQVVMFNDDFTPFEFVVYVLQKYFQKSGEAATNLMLEVHTSGRGICGTYTKDVAETKVGEVVKDAKVQGFALKLEVQPMAGD
jgi:ATP-dependent Clp protease adaptor protein ClpS